MKKLIGLGLLLLLISLPACLEIEETVSVYLGPKEKMDFVAFLDDIHSNEGSPTKKSQEEKDFLRDFRAGKFLKPNLVKSGAKNVVFSLTRREVPFSAVVSGQYDSMEAFWKNFDFNDKPQGKKVQLTRKGDTHTLTFSFPGGAPPLNQIASASRNDFPKHLRIILSLGRFTSAEGFVKSEDGRVCTVDEARYLEQIRKGTPFQMSLSW